MASDRLGAVLRAMADAPGDPTILERTCHAAIALLGVGGSGVSFVTDGRIAGSAGPTDTVISALQEMQLSLGEGPSLDAWHRRESVRVADLRADVDRWPAFSRAAREHGVMAVFAFPLAQGAIRLGALLAYRDRPGGLDGRQTADGLALAEVGTRVVLSLQAGAEPDTLHETLAGEPPQWAHIHQATGMLAAALDTSVDEAFVRLRARAFALGVPLGEMADAVLSERIATGDWP